MRNLVVEKEIRESFSRKTFWKIMPILLLMYLVCYLDRVNISYAALQLNSDIGLSQTAYGFGAGIFFIAYVIFQVPANIMLTKVGPRKWLGFVLVAWGTIAASMSMIRDPLHFFVLRFILGMAEAGFFPAMIFYLSLWFPSATRGRITALAIAAAPLSGMVGGPLSTWLMEHTHQVFFGLHGWQSMFIIEAIPAIVLGVWCMNRLPDRPENTTWLTAEERALLMRDLRADQAAAVNSAGFHSSEPSGFSAVMKTIFSPVVLGLGVTYLALEFGEYALAFFLPLMVNNLNDTLSLKLSLVQVGFVAAIPSLVGAVAMVWWGRRSDRRNERIFHIVLPSVVGAIAIVAAGYSNNIYLSVAAFSITAAAIFSAVPLFWLLPSDYLTGVQAAIGIAAINAMGNFSGLIGPWIIGILKDHSGSYKPGLWVMGMFLVCTAIGVVTLDRVARGSKSVRPSRASVS